MANEKKNTEGQREPFSANLRTSLVRRFELERAKRQIKFKQVAIEQALELWISREAQGDAGDQEASFVNQGHGVRFSETFNKNLEYDDLVTMALHKSWELYGILAELQRVTKQEIPQSVPGTQTEPEQETKPVVDEDFVRGATGETADLARRLGEFTKGARESGDETKGGESGDPRKISGGPA